MNKSRHFPNLRRNPEVEDDIIATLADVLGVDIADISVYRNETVNEKIDRLTAYAEEQATKKTGSDRGRRLTGNAKERWWTRQVDRWIEEALEEKNESDLLASLLAAQRRGVKGRIKKDKIYGGIDVEYMKENGAFSGVAFLAEILLKSASKLPVKDDVYTEIAYLNFLPQFFDALQKCVEPDDAAVYVPQTYMEANARVIKYTLSPSVSVTAQYLQALMAMPTVAFQTALAKACGIDPSRIDDFQTGEYTMEECLSEGAGKINEGVRREILKGDSGTLANVDFTTSNADTTKEAYRVLKDADTALNYKKSLIFRAFMGLTGLPDAFGGNAENQGLSKYIEDHDLEDSFPGREIQFYSLTPLTYADIDAARSTTGAKSLSLGGDDGVKGLIGSGAPDYSPKRTGNYFAAKARAAKKAVSETLKKAQEVVLSAREIDLPDGGNYWDQRNVIHARSIGDFGLYSVPNLTYFDEIEKHASTIGKVVGGQGLANAALWVIGDALSRSPAQNDLPFEVPAFWQLYKASHGDEPATASHAALLNYIYKNDTIESTRVFFYSSSRGKSFSSRCSVGRALFMLAGEHYSEFLLEGYSPLPNGAYKPSDIAEVVAAAKALGQSKLVSGPSTGSFIGSDYLTNTDYMQTLSGEMTLLDDDPEKYAYGGVDPYVEPKKSWLTASYRYSSSDRSKSVPSARLEGARLRSGNTGYKSPKIRTPFGFVNTGRSEATARVLAHAVIAGEVYPNIVPSDLLCAVSPSVAAQIIFERIAGCWANKKYDSFQQALVDKLRQTISNQIDKKTATEPDTGLHILSRLKLVENFKQGKQANATARDNILKVPRKLNRYAVPMLPQDNDQDVVSEWDNWPYVEAGGYRLAMGNEPELYTYASNYGFAVDMAKLDDTDTSIGDQYNWPQLRVPAPQPFQDWTWVDAGASERKGRYGVSKLEYDKDPPGRVGPDLPAGGVKELNQTGVTKIGFGVWVDKDIVYKTFHVRGLFAGLFDLADFLGVSFKRTGRLLAVPSVELGAPYEDGGKNLWLKFGIGQRGKPGAAAHYEAGGSEPNTINMTKINGPGSLFHEMTHYLDFMLYRAVSQSGKDMSGLSSPRWRYSKFPNFCLSNLWATNSWEFPSGETVNETVLIEKSGKTHNVKLLYPKTAELGPDAHLHDPKKLFEEKYGVLPLALGAVNKRKAVHLPFYSPLGQPDSGEYQTVHYASQNLLQQMLGDSVLFAFSLLMRSLYNGVPQPKYVKDKYSHNEYTFMAAYLGVGYWASPLEMLARASEAYAADWFTERDRNSSYLVERARTQMPYGIKKIDGEPQLLFAYPQNVYSHTVLVDKHPTDKSKDKYQTYTGTPFDRVKIKRTFEVFYRYLKLYINDQYCDESPFDIGLNVEELGPDEALTAEVGTDPVLEESEEKGTKLVDAEDAAPDDTGEEA